MATLVLTNPYCVIDGVNLTGKIRKLTLKGSMATHVDTANTTGTGVTSETYVAGMKTGAFEPVFNFVLGAGDVERTLWAIWNAGTAVAFTAAAAGSTAGTANPHFGGSVLLTEAPFIDGAHGEKVEYQPVFQVTGPIAATLV